MGRLSKLVIFCTFIVLAITLLMVKPEGEEEAAQPSSRRQREEPSESAKSSATTQGGNEKQSNQQQLQEPPKDQVPPPASPLSSDEEEMLHSINPLALSQHTISQMDPKTGQMPAVFGNFSCPRFRVAGAKSADGKSAQEHIKKYTRYVHDYCNKTGMLQMNVGLKTYMFILDTIAKIASLNPNDRILDWGSGCGTMLNYYHVKFNTSGIGIDITHDAVAHAKKHHQPNQMFCHMDGSNLKIFPSGYFDTIVSWATLYHVRRTLVQCEIVHEMVRILKPGGKAYIGHLRTEKTQEYWKKGRCRPPGASIVRSRDYRTYHQPSWRRHQFFSLLVIKDKANTSTSTSGGQAEEKQHVVDGGGGGAAAGDDS